MAAPTTYIFPTCSYAASRRAATYTIEINERATGRMFARDFSPAEIARIHGAEAEHVANAMIAMRPADITIDQTTATVTWIFAAPDAIETQIRITILAAPAAAAEIKQLHGIIAALRAEHAELATQLSELRFATIGNRILDYFDANIYSSYIFHSGAAPAFITDSKHWLHRDLSTTFDLTEPFPAIEWRFAEHELIMPPGAASAFTYIIVRISTGAKGGESRIAEFLRRILPYVDNMHIAAMREWLGRMDISNCAFVARCLAAAAAAKK